MPTAPATASPRLVMPAPHTLLFCSRTAFQMVISALSSCCCDNSGCGICQALSDLLPWLPCPALDRQAGEQCAFPPLLGTPHVLEDSHVPCKCHNPPSPLPGSTNISGHRGGIFLPFQILLSHLTENDHAFQHGDRQGEGSSKGTCSVPCQCMECPFSRACFSLQGPQEHAMPHLHLPSGSGDQNPHLT